MDTNPVLFFFASGKIGLHTTTFLTLFSSWHGEQFGSVQEIANNKQIKRSNGIIMLMFPQACFPVKAPDTQRIANWEAHAECCLWSIANRELIAQQSVAVCLSCHALSTKAIWHCEYYPSVAKPISRRASFSGERFCWRCLSSGTEALCLIFICKQYEYVRLQLLTRRLSSNEMICNLDNGCESGEICERNRCISSVVLIWYTMHHTLLRYFIYLIFFFFFRRTE